MIDLRSDTVTRPTTGMREAMMQARVGDDVFAEDPDINALQDRVAAMFGKEKALFFPSGTQANQVAIHVHTRPGHEVICSALAHIYLYEGGGVAMNSGCSLRLLEGSRGMFTADDVRRNINNRKDSHLPWTSLVSVEDTMNKGGGAVWNTGELKKIREVCDEHGLALHCDGARLFNALAVSGCTTAEYGSIFHSISICLSKGLGAPVGSLLVGSEEFIRAAHRRRKSMGGGMRQAGFLAAAGIYALDHHVERLHTDHQRAKEAEQLLRKLNWVREVSPVETNIVIFTLREGLSSVQVVDALSRAGIACFAFGPDKIRFVFHLDISEEDVNRLPACLSAVDLP